MNEEQMRDFELIGFQTCPSDPGGLLKKIVSNNRWDITWAVYKGYLLGYMHGKRAERSRRKEYE